MTQEVEQHYKQYIHKTEIAYLDETCQQRGIFATEDIKYGDVIFKIPMQECFQGTHVELSYMVMDMNNEYSRSLPTYCGNFPVMWNPSEVDSLNGTALQSMIHSRKKKLLEEDIESRGGLFMWARLMVGSRGFTQDKDNIILVPYADMLNHSNKANIDWKVTKDHVVLTAVEDIPKGTECVHTYGTKSNYEHMLFYGFSCPDNVHNDITYELFDIPTSLRSNINYKYFKNTIEFELCGSYSRGTREIFSLVRFLVHKNVTSDDCPRKLHGLNVEPISRMNELMVVKVLGASFVNIYNEKIKKLKDVTEKAGDFIQTELDVLVHWMNVLKSAKNVLEQKTRKSATKLLWKLDAQIYANVCLRPLVLDKKSYIKHK